ncbi:DNAase [Vibrio mediterranei]|uniref:DNAase n=1 Tax=Vibrio mediterranei TaxID=689 RepID=A0AAN1FEL4_9VIBR|nr:DNAase [Vibrio mediterranei]ASI89123.1 DNAase [Vibrio mediterranei]
MIQVVTQSESAQERLRDAFRACPDDFALMQQAINDDLVSIYQIQGDDYHLAVAGEVVGDDYFVWAVEGTGAVQATRELATYVKNSGLKAITTKTYFPLVARLLKRLGNVSTIKQGDHQLLRWEV